MKKTIFTIIILSLLSFPAFADETQERKQRLCTQLSNIAGKAAEAKYAGVPASEIIGLVPKEIHFIVIHAYKLPDFTMSANQEREIFNYSNKVFLDCMELDW